MYDDKVLYELLDLIYGAAAVPAEWAELLGRLSQVLHGSAGSLHSQNANSQEANVAASWNIGPDLIRQYIDYYSQINPCFTSTKELIQQGSVKPRHAFCSDHVLLRSEFYTDYLRRLDAFDGLVATILEDGTVSANLTIFRPRRAKTFGESENALLRVLVPHLQRAFQLHNRVQGLEVKTRTIEEVLDSLTQGVVLLGADGRVLLVNQVATALFASEKALKLTPRGLVAGIPSENRQLNALIEGAIITGDGNGLHSGGAMAISRNGLRQPLQVLVTPLRGKTLRLGKDVPVAAVFISDPDSRTLSNSAVFRQLYGLTPAEARLAHILASGDSLRDAAEKLGVAQSTLRSQLKSIFAKTNTNRQSELIRTLIMAPTGTVGWPRERSNK